MDSNKSTTLMLSAFLILLGKASSFYNRSYDGLTFILPNAVKDGSNHIGLPVELSFSEAQQWCTVNVPGSTLATIRNKDVQQNFRQFITSAKQDNKKLLINSSSNVRLNGQYHITDEWRWVNGRQNIDITVDQRYKRVYHSYARLNSTNFSIFSQHHNRTGRFICEYPDNSRNCDFFLNGRCYRIKRVSLTWYDARNNCSQENGELASFENLNNANIVVTLNNLSLHWDGVYWIGMQKNDWQWNDTGSSIKYTNWDIFHPSNYSLRCLCAAKHDLVWNECDCFEPYPFICSLNDANDTPAATKASYESTQLVIIIASCASIFVVFIIIAAVLVTKKRRNSGAPSQAVKSSGHVINEYAMTGASTDFPVYDEIQEPKELNCASNTTYASVQMAANTNEEHPVNSVVYAELDLKSTK